MPEEQNAPSSPKKPIRIDIDALLKDLRKRLREETPELIINDKTKLTEDQIKGLNGTERESVLKHLEVLARPKDSSTCFERI